MHFLISGDGLIGSAVRKELQRRSLPWIASSRHERFRTTSEWPQRPFLDLAEPFLAPLPQADVVYLVAAMSKFSQCEGNGKSWCVNVDSPIAIARIYSEDGAFVVFISSDAVEWATMSAYGRQKAHVESYLNTIDAAIIRPSKLDPDKAGELAVRVVDIGVNRRAGLHRCGPDVSGHSGLWTRSSSLVSVPAGE